MFFRPNIRTFILLANLGGLLVGGFGCDAQGELTWTNVVADIARRWQQVPQMSGDELQRRLALSGVEHPSVIDVRTREEYDVRHLRQTSWPAS